MKQLKVFGLLLTTMAIMAACSNSKGSIQGIFTDDDEPLEQASVKILDNNNKLVTETFTDNQGQFYVAGLEPGTYSIVGTYTHVDFASPIDPPSIKNTKLDNVVVADDETTNVELQLRKLAATIKFYKDGKFPDKNLWDYVYAVIDQAKYYGFIKQGFSEENALDRARVAAGDLFDDKKHPYVKIWDLKTGEYLFQLDYTGSPSNEINIPKTYDGITPIEITWAN